MLASNDYDFETGEKSVFDRELLGKQYNTKGKKKDKETFEHQDFCQVCGDGGSLYCCPRCPVTLHLSCAGVRNAKELLCCSHHHCAQCSKSASHAGGLIFPCMACPNAYCEDHLSTEDCLVLEDGCDRMEALGYDIKLGIYVLCSKHCEEVAKAEFGWKRASLEKPPCPPPMDLSSYFGGKVDDNLKNDRNESVLVEGKRKRTKVNYASRPCSPEANESRMSTSTSGHSNLLSQSKPTTSRTESSSAVYPLVPTLAFAPPVSHARIPTSVSQKPSAYQSLPVTGQAVDSESNASMPNFGGPSSLFRFGSIPKFGFYSAQSEKPSHRKENNCQLPPKDGSSSVSAIDLCDD